MRVILFRGKRFDNKEWIEGDILQSCAYPDKAYIVDRKTYFDRILSSVDFVQVIPATVSEYTGLQDKNCKKIFEGDIVKDEYNKLWIVKFDFGMFYFDCENIGLTPDSFDCGYSEVVGNVFDNPEIIKNFK